MDKRYDMKKYDDRIDGYNQNEYEALANAYVAENNKSNLHIETDISDLQIFGENNGVEPESNDTTQNDQNLTIKGIEQPLNDNAEVIAPYVEPAPQITYKGLNTYETTVLNDLVLDLRQYFKDDFGLSEYLPQVTAIERPLFYFVNRSKMLSKLMAVLCSIYDKSRLNKELYSLVALLVIVARSINANR